jgi:uncharacterized protein
MAESQKSPQYVNRLISETSPYLLQHARNPVDWHPWGEEALRRAREEDKPILLSVGYSACHWCHVMERESFENPEIAALMNEHFVNVKVDREERPDIDSLYMSAVQMMTGRGGWPMTVFLTPDQTPFYGGTYFPPVDRPGMPGFPRILKSVAEAYRARRDEVTRSADEIREELRRGQSPNLPPVKLTPDILHLAYRKLGSRFDHVHGGFGAAPKFPAAMSLAFLLRYWRNTGEPHALEMVELSLEKMALGGMYDHLGGGFHRYSTDARWLVPHFEKMLYDNALLSRVYLEAHLATGKPLYRRIVEETLDYALREMTAPEGGFYSTQDADSEGEEGKFFVWKRAEVLRILGERDGTIFCRYYDITDEGNFEHAGSCILNVLEPVETVARLKGVSETELNEILARGRRILFEERERRVKPERDDKRLAAWNGLMLRSFAQAGAALGRADYLEAAVRNAEFVRRELFRDGRLLRSFKSGESRFDAYLEDYACYADGLLSLYEATFDAQWLAFAKRLIETALAEFIDEAGGAFFFTARNHETLIARIKDIYDNATPSGNSVAVDVLLRLSRLTGETRYWEVAEGVLESLGDAMGKMSSGFGYLLCALDFYLSAPKEVVIVGDPQADDAKTLIETVRRRFLPNCVVALKTSGDDAATQLIPSLQERTTIDGKATAYVCENFACQEPATTAEALAAQLDIA